MVRGLKELGMLLGISPELILFLSDSESPKMNSAFSVGFPLNPAKKRRGLPKGYPVDLSCA